jgi:microcin C transport system permease protein
MPSALITPLMRRRWQQFKSNRRGYWSLWIFLSLVILTLGNELIANDKPLLVRFDQQFFFPVFVDYPETRFGGNFETAADFRDEYVQNLINANGWIIWPPIRFHYDTINYQLQHPAPSAPDASNWLGTDDQGRDVLARVLYGFRISVWFGLLLTLFSSVIGIALGGIQGYYGGLIDLGLQRFIEIWSSLPVMFILIILSSMVQPNFIWLLLIMLLFSWTSLVDVVRAEFFRGRNLDYVRAAKALGASDAHIMLKHILPNAIVSTLTYLPFILNASIATLTSLDFLGFGLPPGSPSLGELLSQGKANLHAPWLGVTAFIALALLLSLLIFIGEAVRDAFDPRLQRT